MDIIAILEEVPEVYLRIIPLTWKLVREDGTLDNEKVAFYQKELEEALKEAESYAKATVEAIRCLTTLF